ncbi:MAG TPA: hypothetical protein VJ647_04445 [Chitinophagaceae bacterium]|nr:hypothetical protein [Chitinophagaceae bacterium]
MKIIKLGIISLIVFGGMFFVFTLIMPSHIRVSRAIDIQASPVRVEEVLKDMKATDSSFVYQYQVIPFDSVTAVQLYYDFHIKWYNPVQKLGSIVYDKQLGPVMEEYLLQLKQKAGQ